jgi:antitoxin component of MazEF toxin-antitoxin module
MTQHKKVAADPRGMPVGSVKLKKLGNSSGFLLPKEMMARLNLATGDTFYASPAAESILRLTTLSSSRR